MILRILLILLLCSTAWAGEVIVDYEKESVPVLNDALKKVRDGTDIEEDAIGDEQLAPTGVTAGTYSGLTVNEDGRVTAATSGFPTGAIIMWSTDTAPDGFLLCDGSVVSQTTYADLYAVIGHTFAADPGGGNFTLPNMDGRFPYGSDEGADAGDACVGSEGGNTTYTGTDTTVKVETDTTSQQYQTDGGSGPGSIGGHKHTMMPPYLAVAFIIKT